MKRNLVIFLTTAILSASVLAVGFYWISQNQDNRQIDTSWVATINQMLENYSAIENASMDDVTISWCRTYLNENGSSHLIQYGNGDELTDKLYDLTKEATLQLDSEITFDYVQSVTASGKVAELHYRSSLPGAPKNNENYFVLDDLNLGLTGKIIEHRIPEDDYSIWGIPK